MSQLVLWDGLYLNILIPDNTALLNHYYNSTWINERRYGFKITNKNITKMQFQDESTHTHKQMLYKRYYLLSFALLLFLAKVLLSKVVNNSFQQQLFTALLKKDTQLYVAIYLAIYLIRQSLRQLNFH